MMHPFRPGREGGFPHALGGLVWPRQQEERGLVSVLQILAILPLPVDVLDIVVLGITTQPPNAFRVERVGDTHTQFQ